MTFFDYGLPLIALAMGGCGLLIVREMSRRFDRKMAEVAEAEAATSAAVPAVAGDAGATALLAQA